MPGASDSILQVQTAIQVGPMTSGLNTLASAVHSTTSQMNADFEAAFKASQEQVAALTAQMKQMEGELAALKAKLEETGGAHRRIASEATEARHALHGFGEEIGIHMPRFLVNFISQAEGIQPILAAAFSGVAILGMIELIPQLEKKLYDLVQAFRHLDFAKQQAEELSDWMHKWWFEIEQVTDAQRRLSETGLSGLAKISAEHKDNAASLEDYRKEWLKTDSQLDEATQKVQQFQALSDSYVFYDPRKIAAQEALNLALQRQKDLQSDSTKAHAEYTRLVEEQHKNEREAGAKSLEDIHALAEAKTDAEHKAATDAIEAREQAAKQSYTLGLITLEQEVEAEVTASNQKLKADKDYYAAKAAEANRYYNQTGSGAAPAVTAASTSSDEADAEAKNQERIAAIYAAAAQTRKTSMEQEEEAAINAAKSTADAQIKAQEDEAKRAYELHRISSDQETQLLFTSERQRYEAAKKAAEDTAALKSQGAGADPDKQRAIQVRLDAELEVLETEHQSKLNEIADQGQKQRNEDAQRAMEEEIAHAEKKANRQLEAALKLDDERLKHSDITRATWLREETAAVEAWATKQRQVLEQALQQAKAIYNEDSTEYKKLMDKMEELDQQRLNKEKQLQQQALEGWRQWADQVSSQLFNGVNKWIETGKGFKQGMQQTWNSIVLDTIKDIEKIGEKWIEEHVIMAAVAALFGQNSGQQQQQAAKNNAANVTMASSDAAVAAAGTLAYYSTFAPEIAPAMAAAQYAIGLSFASAAAFEKGGIIPNTGIALVHEGEGVLNRQLTNNVMNMTSQRGGNSTTNHYGLNYSPQFHNAPPASTHEQAVSMMQMLRMRTQGLVTQ